MITQGLMQYAGDALKKKVLERSVVSRVYVWHAPDSYQGPLCLRVDYQPVMQSGWGERCPSSTIVNIPGAPLLPMGEDATRLLIDFVTDLMAREVEQKAPRVVAQAGVLEVGPMGGA